MNEYLYWFIAWIVISEIVFIISIRKDYFDMEWIGTKFFSFLIIGMILIVQMAILDPSMLIKTGAESYLFPKVYHWINLLYELVGIIFISFFFLTNKLIAERIKGGK